MCATITNLIGKCNQSVLFEWEGAFCYRAGMALAERVREAREDLGLSQEALAALAGCKQQTIAAIESGQTKQPRNIKQLAKALGRSVAWLMDETDLKGIEPHLVEEFRKLNKNFQRFALHQVETLVKYFESLPGFVRHARELDEEEYAAWEKSVLDDFSAMRVKNGDPLEHNRRSTDNKS